MNFRAHPQSLHHRLRNLFDVTVPGGREFRDGHPLEIVTDDGDPYVHSDIGVAYVRCQIGDLLQDAKPGRATVAAGTLDSAIASFTPCLDAIAFTTLETELRLEHPEEGTVDVPLGKWREPRSYVLPFADPTFTIELNRKAFTTACSVTRSMSSTAPEKYQSWTIGAAANRLRAVAGRGNFFDIYQWKSDEAGQTPEFHRFDFHRAHASVVRRFTKRLLEPEIALASQPVVEPSGERRNCPALMDKSQCLVLAGGPEIVRPSLRVGLPDFTLAASLQTATRDWHKPIGGIIAAVGNTQDESPQGGVVTLVAAPDVPYIQLEYAGPNACLRRIPIGHAAWSSTGPRAEVRGRVSSSSLGDLVRRVDESERIQLDLFRDGSHISAHLGDSDNCSASGFSAWGATERGIGRQQRTLLLHFKRQNEIGGD